MKTQLFLSSAAVAITLAACGPAEDAATPTDAETSAATETRETAAAEATNPLLAEWDTPFGAPPFSQIEEAHFLPAFDVALASHREEIDAIASNDAEPTFENTLLAMENAGADLTRISRVFFNLTSSASNDEIRAIQREMSPRLAAHNAAITLNADLFARIETIYNTLDERDLTAQQRRLVEVTYENFTRAGAQLEGDDRERFAEIRSELAGLYTQFSQNEQADREAWTLSLSEEDLADLPAYIVSAAAGAAADRDIDGHVVTLARSSVEPFLQTSPNRELREEAWRA